VNCQHLIRLAEGWRSKAASLKARYHAASPNLVDHVVMALETCASELEDEVRAALAVVEVPSARLQVESSKPATFTVQPAPQTSVP
jgi:hypothetical protein